MKTITKILIALLLVAVCVVSFINWTTLKKNDQAERTSLLAEIDGLKNIANLNHYNLRDEAKVLPVILDNELFNFSNGKLRNKKLLVIRYSELNCDMCVEDFVKTTQNVFKDTSTHVLFLVDYKTEAYLNTFVRMNKVRYPILKIQSHQLGLESDELNVPYAFVTDEHLKVNHLFFPILGNNNRSVEYLTAIKERYFTK